MKRVRIGELVSGIALVVLGAILLLGAMGVRLAPLSVVLWSAVVVWGAVLAARGWMHGSSVRMFVGAFLVLAGGTLAAWASDLLRSSAEEAIACGFLWVGLAFAFVWLSAPHKLDVLAMAVLFGGPGIGYYLWWWEIVSMRTLRDLTSDGWPVVIILVGAGVLLRSLKPRVLFSERNPES